MDKYFTALGRSVYAEWKKHNFSLQLFPEIARRALEEKPPSENVDLSDFIRDVLLNDEQPQQTHSGFGQPEIVVFHDPKFYIQVLFWLDGTTQIHQHEFSGAFHVWEGSSLHSVFEFNDSQPVSAHFRVGNLRLTHTELLETGRTIPIVSGRDCIHSLFHLEMPSLTVVIRTQSDVGTGPQFTYLPPHVAVDPFHEDTLTHRRNQLLDVVEKMEDPTYPEVVIEMIEELDFERGFFVLQNSLNYLKRLGQWEQTLAAFEMKHGKLAEGIGVTLDEMVWRDELVRLRSSVEEPDHRFFLALLLNVPQREDILSLVEQRFSGPAADTIMTWAEELSEEDGSFVLDAQFPPELEVSDEDRLDIFLSALRYFVQKEFVTDFTLEQLEFFRAAFLNSSLRVLVA